MMKSTYLLLPFTHGVDVCAIEQAILLAKGLQATLVPLALIQVSEERKAKGVRLEHVQQSKDFLEVVKHKAARYALPVERFEAFTSDVVQSIKIVASEMECEGILLFLGRKDGILLQSNEIKRLIEVPTCKLYIMRLQTSDRVSFTELLRQRFSHWWPKWHTQQDEQFKKQECSEDTVTTPIGV
jgi:hypothetical protein